MDDKERVKLHKNFHDYIKANDNESSVSRYNRTMAAVLDNPSINDLGSLFSDWQGHATISMKRALFSISAISLIQIFVFGEAFLAQFNALGFKASPDNTLRLLVVVTLSLICSGTLYLAAVTRDKTNRDYKATRLTKALNAHLSAEKELQAIYNKFRSETKNTSGTFSTALIGSQIFNDKYKRYRNLQPILQHYEILIKPSQKKQWLLDSYDIYVIPAIGVLTIVLIWIC